MSEPEHNAKPVIFIVDDDAAVRDSVRLLMESYGWLVSTFDSADAFLRKYPAGQKGCLILDLHMPGMNGVELQERLQQLGITLPVIMITAHKEESLIKRAQQAGAHAVVLKPFKGEELLANVEQALAGC